MKTSVDVAGSGFAVIDRLYERGSKQQESLGGSCANVLWSLAMLNRSVVPILSLGDDATGFEMVHEFESVGADTRYITRHAGRLSPVLVQFLDATTGEHHFSFTCPDTSTRFPAYRPIELSELDAARPIVENCAVFYSDRISPAIVEAMRATAEAGGIVYFEPSAVSDEALFRQALRYTSIIKFSEERLGHVLRPHLSEMQIFGMVTHGERGLEVVHGNYEVSCSAITAPRVLDTCGSGDMVSVGLIDRLLGAAATAATLSLEHVVAGARAGQSLASANCGFVGARGLFRELGAAAARQALDTRH
ncbi:PfkB family carbohydrate kinase [Devosia pacifica]|uniref:PfkB family carbohydrate kinase n=1 Tax=Devosia pacifica TaxID=1335967 RepID=UPI001673BB05|nr:PfkB family carbohydrate kinase [Devosia pacifica]